LPTLKTIFFSYPRSPDLATPGTGGAFLLFPTCTTVPRRFPDRFLPAPVFPNHANKTPKTRGGGGCSGVGGVGGGLVGFFWVSVVYEKSVQLSLLPTSFGPSRPARLPLAAGPGLYVFLPVTFDAGVLSFPDRALVYSQPHRTPSPSATFIILSILRSWCLPSPFGSFETVHPPQDALCLSGAFLFLP